MIYTYVYIFIKYILVFNSLMRYILVLKKNIFTYGTGCTYKL